MSKAWKGGSTTAWRKVRLVVLARDQYRCRLALPGVCTGLATQVHHVLGKASGDDPAHLVSSCRGCNLKVGDPLKRKPGAGADPPGRAMTRW